MHEAFLVDSLWKQVSRIAAGHPNSIVKEIVVELGPLSGFEPLLVQTAFVRAMELHDSPRVSLTLLPVPLVFQCDVCDRESETQEPAFRCSHCDSNRVRVVRGDGVVLKSVILETAALAARESEESPV